MLKPYQERTVLRFKKNYAKHFGAFLRNLFNTWRIDVGEVLGEWLRVSTNNKRHFLLMGKLKKYLRMGGKISDGYVTLTMLSEICKQQTVQRSS